MEAQEEDGPVAAAVEANEGGRNNIIIRKAYVPGWEGGTTKRVDSVLASMSAMQARRVIMGQQHSGRATKDAAGCSGRVQSLWALWAL